MAATRTARIIGITSPKEGRNREVRRLLKRSA
jgi:hypothetical protein